MFETNRVKFGMKARALEETAKEIKNSFGSADEYYYYDDVGTLRGQGGIGAILEYMMHEVPYTKEYAEEGSTLGFIEAGFWEYNEDVDASEWKTRGTIEVEDILGMIDEHKYVYEFYRDHCGDIQEDFTEDLENALLMLKSGETDRIFVRYLNSKGWVDDAFEITYDDIESNNKDFWTRHGKVKPALIRKIEDMELKTWK